MSWNGIAQNLAVETSQLIGVYKGSDNIGEFHRSIMNLKKPIEGPAPSKPSKTIAVKPVEPPVTITPEIKPTGLVTPKILEFEAPVDPNEQATRYQLYLQELGILKQENERLNKELLSRDANISMLETVLASVKREKEKYENSYYVYMDKLDKVRTALEKNTPARAIIEWIENGGEE